MADIDWVFYDTQDVGTSVNTDIEFFANEEGVDGKQVTNLQTKNEIAANETFTIKEIEVFSTGDIAGNDIWEIMEESIIEVFRAQNRKLIIPGFLAGASWEYWLAAEDKSDASQNAIGTPSGGPYKLKNPIVLKGGENFSVKFRTGTTAAASGAEMIIALRGTLAGRF